MLGFTTECLREDNWVDLPAKFLRCKRAGLDTESDAPIQISGQVNKLKTRPDEDKKYKKEFIDMRRSTTVGFSIAFPDKTSYYVPLQHKRNNAPYSWGLQALKEILAISKREGYPIGIHKLSQELMAFEKLGINEEVRTNGSLYCTLVASWMAGYDAKPQWNLGLKHLSKRLLKHEMTDFQTVVGGTGAFGIMDPRSEEASRYACEDAIGALKLLEMTKPTLRSWGLTRWFNEVEMPFVWVLNHCSDTGMSIDADGFTKLHADAAEEVWRTKEAAQDLLGVDLGSTSQLQKLFDEGYWIPSGEKGKSGDYGINQDTWGNIIENQGRVVDPEKRAVGHRMIELLSDYKDVAKVYSTYSANLVRLAAHSVDGKLHPNFKHAGVSTGRIAAANPNSTNQPSRGAAAKEIIKNFVAPPGRTLLSADYSQIDLRVLANFSGGETLESFKDLTRDPHQELADAIGVSRDAAKTIMYMKVFGGGVGRLSMLLNCPRNEASAISKNFNEQRPEISAFAKKVVASAYRKGYVKTLSGRRKQFPWFEKVDQERVKYMDKDIKDFYSSLERKAGNLPPQGGSADVVKYAMVRIFLDGMPKDMLMVTQIHDDIRVEIGDDHVEEGMEYLQRKMEAAQRNEYWELSIPLVAEPVSGKNWKELKG